MLAFLKQIPFWESYLELRKWHLIYTSRFNTGLKLYNGQYNWTDGSKIQLTFWDAYQVIHSASNFNCFISNTSGYWYYGECQTYHTNPYVCKYSRGKSKSTSIFFISSKFGRYQPYSGWRNKKVALTAYPLQLLQTEKLPPKTFWLLVLIIFPYWCKVSDHTYCQS